MSTRSDTDSHGGRGVREEMPARAALFVVAAAALAALTLHFSQAFTLLPEMGDPGNGTPWAPHSNALGPWLDGGLAYLFGVTPPHYLYRPTVGLYWASLLAATGRVELIPVFFGLWIFAACAIVALFAADRPARSAVILLLLFGAIRFPDTWIHLGHDVDLASLALTLSGTLLVLLKGDERLRGALLVGCVALGAAAAIRGPMMFAGPLAIATRALFVERMPARTFLLALGMFAAPIVLDIALQRYLDTDNNGVQALFCVYWDPSHGWTPACKAEYNARRPPGMEVLQGFIGYRLSGAGMGVLWSQFSARLARDLLPIHSPGTILLVLGFAALETARHGARPGPTATVFVKALALVATLVLLSRAGPFSGSAATAWVFAVMLFAAAARNGRALLCFATYVAGVLFLALAGAAVHDRLVQTFAFTLVLGISFLIFEQPPGNERSATLPARGPLAIATGIAILFLYSGSLMLPSGMRETYRRDVLGRQGAALKVGEDTRINRSLYYTGARMLVYTRSDAIPVGGVRRYGRLATRAQGNASFVQPNAFVD